MSRLKLTKPQKTLTAIIESEGGTIVDLRKGSNHLQCDYTFDHRHFFTQYLPYGDSLTRRWEHNFRSTVRKTKRQLET